MRILVCYNSEMVIRQISHIKAHTSDITGIKIPIFAANLKKQLI